MHGKKYGILISLAVLLLITFIELRAQPEIIILNNVSVFNKKERTPVAFPHELHMEELSCSDCHHRYEKGKNILDESELEEGNIEIQCSNCHGLKTKINLRKAFHRQCIGCHSRYKKEGYETGPRLCGECHPWKEK